MTTDFLEALKNKKEIQITVRRRQTKKEYKITIWFVQKENKFYLLPVKGSDTNWYKNVLEEPYIILSSDNIFLSTKVDLINENDEVNMVIGLFAAKYGGMDEIKRWYSKLDVGVEVLIKENDIR